MHKEENPKAKKKQVKDKGKNPVNVPKIDHDMLLIESVQNKSEEYKLLNDILTKEIKSLRKEMSTNAENKKRKAKQMKEDKVEEGKKETGKVEESEKVKELRNQNKLVREKYLKIQAEDRKYRGILSKEIYNISDYLHDTKRMFKRIKPVKRQLENLYKNNFMLKARIRKMNNKMNEERKEMETGHLNLLAQVDLEWEEQQFSQIC